MKKIFLIFCFCSFILVPFFAQEITLSDEDVYYSGLSLTGEASRPFLNYKTVSDSCWKDINPDNIWSERKLNTSYTLCEIENTSDNKFFHYFLDGIPLSVSFKPYGLKFFDSYNTKAPFGQDDGALWQGRGNNLSVSGGFRFDAFGFSLTFYPQFSFSENKEFDIMYSSWGNGFGYFWGNCDAPQRFGDESFTTFDWGESEIRWSWKKFTVGFGTESVWLGPNVVNPLLLSNNAASFPKFDIGLKKATILFPYFKWNLGEIEARMMVGKLSESAYFDDNPDNDNQMYLLYSISYVPPFADGLTIGFNKVCICKWADDYIKYYLNPFYSGNRLGDEGEDQKASVTFDWLLPESGCEFYAEIGVDDYPSSGLHFYELARFPLHTLNYTVGYRQSIKALKNKNLRGVINFEWNCTEPSQDYQMWGGYNFGMHGQIKQGYTNKGQWLGSGFGYGGDSQYLSFTLFSKHGYDKFYIARNNPDNAFIYQKATYTDTAEMAGKYFTAFKANFYTGYETMWFIKKNFSVKGAFTYNLIINPLYNPGYTGKGSVFGKTVDVYREYTYWHNFNFSLGANLRF